jgi:hypothetical protein
VGRSGGTGSGDTTVARDKVFFGKTHTVGCLANKLFCLSLVVTIEVSARLPYNEEERKIKFSDPKEGKPVNGEARRTGITVAA